MAETFLFLKGYLYVLSNTIVFVMIVYTAITYPFVVWRYYKYDSLRSKYVWDSKFDRQQDIYTILTIIVFLSCFVIAFFITKDIGNWIGSLINGDIFKG